MKGQNEPGVRTALIGLGSNLDPEQNIIAALDLLNDYLFILDRSAIWQTPAVGSQGPDYLNAAVLVETELTLPELRQHILAQIENELGRVRHLNKYADRTIDLDVLIYNGDVIDEELWNQAHFAVPSAELLPDLENPETGELLSRAARRLLPGTGFIKRADLY